MGRKAPVNGLSGKPLCELLEYIAKEGRAPEEFPCMLTEESLKDDKRDENSTTVLQTSSGNSIDDEDELDDSFTNATNYDMIASTNPSTIDKKGLQSEEHMIA